MFVVHCARHGRDVLLPEDRIARVRNSGDGIEVRWVCWCGHRGSLRPSRMLVR